ncbi:polygalacturonase-like protein [Coniochaeta sp. 2T2.1]|nr:polygalacturonase-like protein [Coniochaeta sp. 2T2.1]
MYFVILIQLLSVLSIWPTAASAAIVKRGATCTVTPLSATPRPRRSIGTVHPAARDVDLDATSPGSPEPVAPQWPAPGRYPRPAPSQGSHPPAERMLPPTDTLVDRADHDSDELVDHHTLTQRDLAATIDDTPQILSAFKQCGKDGTIIFTEGVFNIRQVMNTTDLSNCDIEIHGTFLWSADNIASYWLRSTYSVTYAGRSTAWLFGGRNVSMRGFGKALFDGNGQAWIDQNRGGSNQNGRPISLTVWRGTNIYIDGLTWRQAQFWHTFIAHSQNVTMTNLDMNTTSHSQWSAVNTDGTDTWNSRDIVISNWTVTSGDDCISVKGNSTNVHVSNIVCYESGGMCVGSIGSNAGQPDYVDNVVFENVTLYHSSNAAWIKTYPGQGHVRNVTFRNIRCNDVNQPIYVTSCIYSGQNCDGSRLGISDVRWENITGTSRYNIAAGMHCSGQVPCTGFNFSGIDIKPKNGGTAKVMCSNIKNQVGLKCDGACPGNWPQQLSGNR